MSIILLSLPRAAAATAAIRGTSVSARLHGLWACPALWRRRGWHPLHPEYPERYAPLFWALCPPFLVKAQFFFFFQITDINGLLTAQSKLKWLNVSSNSLQWFDYAFIPKNLEWLNIQHNTIEEIGNYYHLREGFGLHTLEASYNRIK